jgi:hypothetical protein
VQRNAGLNAVPNIALQTHATLWRCVNILQRNACDRLAQHVNVVTAASAWFVALFNRKDGRGSLKSYYNTPRSIHKALLYVQILDQHHLCADFEV